jgi:predicted dehydrogenase
MSYGFGIVGLGMIADFHARAIGDLANGHLAAVCSRSQDKAEDFAAKYGCKAYTSVDAILADDEVNVLTICTPSGAHLEPTLKAADAGVHVVCEKPLEIALDRVDRMIAAHEKAGTVLAGIFQSRFNPVNQLVKQAVDDGRFGRLAVASTCCPWWRTQEYYDEGGWKGTRALDGGGALMNQSIHAIDALQWIAGPVRSIMGRSATIAHPQIEVEDTAAAVLEFESGALGLILGATSMYPGTSRRLEIAGDAGTVFCVEDTITTWSFAEETEEDRRVRAEHGGQASSGGSSDPAAIDYSGHTRCFESALAAIESGQPPMIGGHEARKAIEIILAIYESSKTGRRVDLPLAQ